MKLLSICIPSYNHGKFIGKLLNSILLQITDEVEVIVVDGASTDDTMQVFELYPQVKVLTSGEGEENGGFMTQEEIDQQLLVTIKELKDARTFLNEKISSLENIIKIWLYKGDGSKCMWSRSEDYDDETWHTDCGQEFVLWEEATPTECEFNYCAFCGRKLEEEITRGECD